MKLYCGNLPPSFTDKELEELFTPFGAVKSAKVIIDRDSGRSKGFGFVEMDSNDEATNAMKELNGKVVGTRPIVVNEARPQRPNEGRREHGGGGGGFRQRSFNR